MSKDKTIALIGEDAPKSVINSLCKMGFEVLILPRDPRLPSPVSSHADMLVFVLGERIFCYDDYYKCNKKAFDVAEKEGYEIIKTTPASSSYPNDIALNVLKIGNFIYMSLKNNELLLGYETLLKNKLELINGYINHKAIKEESVSAYIFILSVFLPASK